MSTSNNLSARKNVLLDATISTHESYVGGISKIIGTKRSNLIMPWSGVALFKFLKCFNGPFLKGKKMA
jgi:hypothetical protein